MNHIVLTDGVKVLETTSVVKPSPIQEGYFGDQLVLPMAIQSDGCQSKDAGDDYDCRMRTWTKAEVKASHAGHHPAKMMGR